MMPVMKINGPFHTVKYALLKAHTNTHDDSRGSKGSCWCCKLSHVKQIAFILVVVCAVLLIAYKGVWSTSTPHDVFSVPCQMNSQAL